MSLSVAFVIVAQFVIGLGPTTRFRAVNNGFSLLGLSILTGLGISSVLPFVLQFMHQPIALGPLCVGLGLFGGLSLSLLRGQGTYLKRLFNWQMLALRLCELPFLAFWGYLLFISAWKCVWFPNLPFDTIVGPDLVATYAVKEQTLVSSVFTAHLPSVSVFSNQPFYAPFTAMQQIIYLLAAGGVGPFAFGKLWLTLLVVAFGLFFYAELRERIHPLLAGILVCVLTCTPELFAYTFLLQTDWANAAFFGTGVILLQRYLETGRHGVLAGSALLLAFACWTRTETIFFIPIGSLLVLVKKRSKAIYQAIALFLACLLPVLFWNYGFLRGHVPLPSHTQLGQVHTVPNDYVGKLLTVFTDMNKQVVFSIKFWGYSVLIFLALTLLNGLFFRGSRGVSTFVWIVGVYVIFGLIIQHVDGANVPFTFRRGFFKLPFLMYFYLATSHLFGWLSGWLNRWEIGKAS